VVDSSALYNIVAFQAFGIFTDANPAVLTLYNDRAVFNGTAMATVGMFSAASLSFADCLISNNMHAYQVIDIASMSDLVRSRPWIQLDHARSGNGGLSFSARRLSAIIIDSYLR
jgi:hypothetical protein